MDLSLPFNNIHNSIPFAVEPVDFSRDFAKRGGGDGKSLTGKELFSDDHTSDDDDEDLEDDESDVDIVGDGKNYIVN